MKIIIQKANAFLETMTSWTEGHLSKRQLTLILAFAVGLLAALAAYILHSLIHIIQHFPGH